MHDVINIDGKAFSSQHPFIVAEIGINHNGDMGLAKETIAAAAEAGADSVKFQNYKTEDFLFDNTLTLTYQSQGETVTEPQFELFKRCEISCDQILLLNEEAKKYGLNFHSTPTSLAGIEDLKAANCTVLKNGSDFLTNLNLIKQMGETGLLTVLSTGMATLSEIDHAVQTFRATGNEKLVLLHCTSAYPTPVNEINMAQMQTLAQAFSTPVGFSDHSDGITAATVATTLGAVWIEKHFTLDKNLPGPDHWFSMDGKELKGLVSSVRSAEQMIGQSAIGPTPSEAESRSQFRLSCVANKSLASGAILQDADIVFSRPGTGIPPVDAKYILGRKLNQTVAAGAVLNIAMFD